MNIFKPLLKLFKESEEVSQKEENAVFENRNKPVFEGPKVGGELEETILSDDLQNISNEEEDTTSANNVDEQAISPDELAVNNEADKTTAPQNTETDDNLFSSDSEKLVQPLEDGDISDQDSIPTKEPDVIENSESPDDITADAPVPEEQVENEMQTGAGKDVVIDKPEEKLPPSLLDNKPFVKLTEECLDLMNEFEGYIARLETDEGKMMAEMLVKRFQEMLERSGLQRIDDKNEPFSVLRHIPVPMEPVSEGTLLEKIICSGLALENRVFRKAKVKVQKTK